MSKQGVILLNLGSPDSTEVSDVRSYLREFLMDGRVLDAPFAIRWFLVNCLILPTRPRESAEAYAEIWQDEGSPSSLPRASNRLRSPRSSISLSASACATAIPPPPMHSRNCST